jgi:hypothetical protein
MREHSASLLTIVLAAAVQTRRRPEDPSLCRKLYGHMECLLATAVSTNAKSPELVLVRSTASINEADRKALLIMYLWPFFPRRNVDDRSRM